MTKLALHEGLPAPLDGPVDLLIVAGEHSGDEHAANMLRGLLVRNPGLKVCALGGPRLASAGAQLLRDLTANATMGFAVLGQMSSYLALIADITRWAGRHRPRAVCFVDSSALNLRIAKAMYRQGFSAKAGGPTKTLYYISPQIWASRAGRRFEMARHLDGLAAIFPFEPACYADTNLPVEFVGHPFVSPDYAAPVGFDPSGPVLLLPGSRPLVVARIFPVLLESFKQSGIPRDAMVLYPSDEILTTLQQANPPVNVSFRSLAEGRARPPGAPNTDGRPSGPSLPQSPIAASAVLTASGTMSMHCALAGIPGAIAYRTDPLTYLLGRLLVKVEYIGIANLLLKAPMYPEFIQGAAKPAVLAAQLRESLSSRERIAQTKAYAAQLHALLQAPTRGTAADWVARHLA